MIFLGAIVIAYLLSKKYYSFNKPKFINGLYERSKSINWKNAILILANLFLLKILSNNLPTILKFYVDDQAIGQFSFAAKLGSLILTPLLVSSTIIPKLLKEHQESKIISYFMINSIITFMAVITILTFHMPLINLIGINDNYLNTTVLKVICFGYLIQSSFGPIGIILNMKGKNAFVLKSVLISLGISVALLNLLPKISIFSFAVLFFINLFLMNIIQAIKVTKIIPGYRKVILFNLILFSILLWTQYL